MRLPSLITTAVILASNTAFADIYIPEGEPGTVLHLDNDFQVVDRITGLDNIHGMGGAPNRGILVAGSLTEIPSDEVEKPASVSEDEHSAHHGGNKKPSSGEVSQVTLVDAESHEILQHIEVPGFVHHVAVSSDERYAVVTHPGLDGISVIDLENGLVKVTVATGPIPEYAVSDSKSGRFFISNAGNDTVSEVDPEAGIVIRNFKIPSSPNHMQLDADTRQLFVSESDYGKVSVIDVDSGNVLESYEIGGGLHGVAANAETIWSSARERDRVVRINRATGERIEAEIGPEPYHMALINDALLVSSAYEPVLWTLDPETLELRGSVHTKDTAHQFVEIK